MFLFTASISARGEKFLFEPKICTSGGSRPVQFPQDPFHFISHTIQNQGPTGTCGFHSGTVMLEVLVNSQSDPKSSKISNLSVIHSMEQLGICTKPQFESAGISPAKFLLGMRESRGVYPFSITVAEHYQLNQCVSTLDRSTSPLIPIPPFNIQTRDFMGNDDDHPEFISENLLWYFKTNNALPLDFSICVDDLGKSSCLERRHGMALIGVRKVVCGQEIFYTGIFKNSWNKKSDEFDLIPLLKGMKKYRLGYTAIHPCKGSECLSPPIYSSPQSNVIYHLAGAGDAQGIKKLYLSSRSSVNLNLPGPNGISPIAAAVIEGHLKVVNFLVTHGADKDKRNNNGSTPLYTAASWGYIKVVEFLVTHGADKDKANTDGRTPLYTAAFNGHLEVVEFLVTHSADKDKADNDGWTPLITAADDGHLNIVQFLVKNGSKLELPNNDGFTPLAQAVFSGHLEVVQYLTSPEVGANHFPSAMMVEPF